MRHYSYPLRNGEKLFDKLDLSGLESWASENKEKALDLLAEFHDIFTLADGEMGCTEVVEHHIEVTDPVGNGKFHYFLHGKEFTLETD